MLQFSIKNYSEARIWEGSSPIPKPGRGDPRLSNLMLEIRRMLSKNLGNVHTPITRTHSVVKSVYVPFSEFVVMELKL